MQKLSSLTIDDQRKIVSGEGLPVATGADDHVVADPLKLTPQQLRIVFDRGRIRSPHEQAEMIKLSSKKSQKPKASRKRCRADKSRGGIVIGRSFAPLDEVLEALAELRDADFDDTLEETDQVFTVQVKVDPSRHQQLKIRAAKSRCTMAELVRRSLSAAGLFSSEKIEVEEDA